MEILELKSIIIKMNISLARLNNRFELVEERIGKLKDKSVDIFSLNRKKKE